VLHTTLTRSRTGRFAAIGGVWDTHGRHAPDSYSLLHGAVCGAFTSAIVQTVITEPSSRRCDLTSCSEYITYNVLLLTAGLPQHAGMQWATAAMMGSGKAVVRRRFWTFEDPQRPES
jgi:hypothetical protein